MKRLIHDLLMPRHRRRALAALRKLEYRLPSARSRFAIPFVFRGQGHFKSIRPRQTPSEIERAYEIVLELAPRRVLEIGTAKGGTLYLWTQAATDDAVIVSVDLPGGQFGGGYAPCRIPFYEAFQRPGQTLHLLRADSHDPATAEQVRQLFAGEGVDFCFIDGDHQYPGVRADLLTYGPLVRPGGLIGFHDILPAPHDPNIQVHQLWEQLREHFATEELIGHDNAGRRIGIGLARVPDTGFPAALELR